MAPYRIILADKNTPLRLGIRRILAEQADLEIFGEAWDGLNLLSLLKSAAAGPLMVILDLSLVNLQGPEGIRMIKAMHPDAKVLILSMHEDVEYLSLALSTGAEGYLMIEHVDKELLGAIETIKEGKVYVSPMLAGTIPAGTGAESPELSTHVPQKWQREDA